MSDLKGFVQSRNQLNGDLKVPIPGQSGTAQPRYYERERNNSPHALAIKLERLDEHAVSDLEESNYSGGTTTPERFVPGTESSPSKKYAIHSQSADSSLRYQAQLPYQYMAHLPTVPIKKTNLEYETRLAELKNRMRTNVPIQGAPPPPIPALLRSNSYPTTSSGNESPIEEVPGYMRPRPHKDIPVTYDYQLEDDLGLQPPSTDVQAEPPTPQRHLQSPSPQPFQQVHLPLTWRRQSPEEPAHHLEAPHLPHKPDNRVLLDYDEAQLRMMDFQDLKDLPFDKDPNAEPFVLPKNNAGDTLASRLEQVAKLPTEEQKQFFASLTINEWEDAGDWFLERFGDVFKQLKSLRREMRAASLALENECEARYTAVENRRKETEAALAAMRERGEKVLLSNNSPSRD